MLLSLSINNFTLVEQLEVDFASGMTAITGETGAGKSLVLDALGMALGDRADTDLIRHNTNKLEISAHFDISKLPATQQWLAEQDVENDDNTECLLRRVITREGRSRGYINGSTATMLQLRTLGEMLLDIHSQHEHQSLLRKETHRLLLDNFCDAQSLTTTVKTCYHDWKTASDKLADLTSRSEELAAQRELLDFQVNELDQLMLSEDELPQLEQEHQLLANAESILGDSHTLLAICQGETDFNLQKGLNDALHLLSKMPSKTAALENVANILGSASIEITEACNELQHHIDSFEINPQRLAQLDERLSIIYELARKHRVTASELFAKHQQLKTQLEALSGGSESIAQLTNKTAELADAYLTKAKQLSQLRAVGAEDFAAAVNTQLAELSMKGASLRVAINRNAEQKFTAHGLESIEFLISTNPGQPAGPLAKIASGGELSRVSLAIQVIAAQHSEIPTLLFDEVDVGIGGATAEVVGRMLKELGDRGQVICITHQPQVACCGHQHLLAEKSSSADGAESHLTVLDEQQRMSEIARMLGGKTITQKTLEHAREMIAMNS